MSVSVIVMGVSGRMGSTIARLVADAPDLKLAAVAEHPDHLDRVTLPTGSSTRLLTSPGDQLFDFPGAVIVDFTASDSTMNTARAAARHGNPMVIGTTGFSDAQKQELAELAQKTPIFLSPNMSVGVNVLLNILPRLTAMLGDAYDVEISEIHHNRKKDAPSGTAVRLAETLADAKGWDLAETGCYCRKGMVGERPHEEIGVQSLRGGDVVGVHTVYYFGPGERIEVTHHAHSRDNFANGALRAVRWMAARKPGRIYSMNDVLDSNKD